MLHDGKLFVAKSNRRIYLLPQMSNRHGLISGATGTGKTTTLKVMAESFSDLGVPVFMADIKGDLGGMCRPGLQTEGMLKRIERFGLEGFTFTDYPTRFWDIYGEFGHPVRATISDMGPLLLSRLLGLNNTQTGILNIVFRVADEKQMLLIDLKDLRSMLQYVSDNASAFRTTYGNISAASVGAILRALLAIEDQGGHLFFGEPNLEVTDWMRTDHAGRGMINVLHCEKLFQNPDLYSTFLLWLLSELYEVLPEVGDLDKPKIVFFFDEAHLLFKEAPKVLIQKIEQVVRLIRSKGVGVYFVTQSPMDVPDSVLAQLGNRIQHALRAYTPAEQKVVRTAANTFRQNPDLNTMEAIMEVGVGEALVSFLDEKGIPNMVERANILPPQSLMGTIGDDVRMQVIQSSEFNHKYGTPIDRDSAYEILERMRQQREQEETMLAERQALEKERLQWEKEKAKLEKAAKKPAPRKQKGAIERMTDSALNTVGREVTRSLIRGLMGGLKK
jgi:DNA helicase HerA-like ATPase